MNHSQLANLASLETDLWSAADNLRANSKLTAGEYCMPVLGVIFLRHATNRYAEAQREIEADQAAGKMPRRPLSAADFKARRALLLPVAARYDTLLQLPKGADLGSALVEAMNAIERDFEPLQGQLPKDYHKFENTLLEDLLRVFDSAALRTASGDVFGRINEYFLMKFAMQGAQDNGEFFTPPSLVQTLVHGIEPDHGIVFDPACGSGGMFVQSSHFIEQHGQMAAHRVTFYGQEYKTSNLRLAKMNLAVHALQGDIVEANTFYEDPHELHGKCDFVMANPPFNVDKVDAEKVRDDRRLPFGLPGVNKEKKVSNGNYLWISYFWSYLNPTGRAGFVMSSQASSAGHGEMEVRRKLVESGDVDVMISIRSGFFYTRTVPCELWFFDKGKPAERKDSMLMLDARNVARKLKNSRKIWEFSPDQQQNLAAIVWLWRGQTERFAALLANYEENWRTARRQLDALLPRLVEPVIAFSSLYKAAYHQLSESQMQPHLAAITPLYEAAVVVQEWAKKLPDLHLYRDHTLPETQTQYPRDAAAFRTALQHFQKLATQAIGALKPTLERPRQKEMEATLAALQSQIQETTTLLTDAIYWVRQVEWLRQRFPVGRFCAVPGLCRIVSRAEIAAADWSLTPGRYVGVAPAEVDEDFDFGQTLREIHLELADLNTEATTLAAKIQANFEGLTL